MKKSQNSAGNEYRSRMLGIDALVKLKNGRRVPAINLDNAATTPAFSDVAEEVRQKLMYYGSIGRGKGQKSEISTVVYTEGRSAVKKFVGADNKKYTVLYCNNTTDGMNKLASALITSPRDLVLSTRMEHHANDLPWRERCRTVYADVDGDGRLRIADMERLLQKYDRKIKYVTVAAASNVTGYVNDVRTVAGLAHRYGAKIIVDGAQIVAHRAFSMLGEKGRDEDIDFFVFSAHKMYSPYGGGAIVGLKQELDAHLPAFYGGGMVEAVTDGDVDYADAPDLYEAGSPNYPGVVGMLKAIQLLSEAGFDYIREHEQTLLRRAIDKLRNEVPSAILYGDCDNIEDRVGILTFNLKTVENEDLADRLAAYSAIAVRHAKFCAHTYVDRLLGEVVPSEADRLDAACVSHKGMVRISFGIYNTEEDVDALIAALQGILAQPDAFAAVEVTSRVAARRNKYPGDRG
ncbi:MAG: aminotransferase class V-fold PLP-dependent enzyme [Clostridiales bacterium]|jgi:selenocysteine lyase/cysteine desulfurase|nr:aminotransferase class V-fold PLP-dependent enzyme [Clostridiales bacterium]